MARSVLLQLARDSIAEVIEAKRTIDANELLASHPLLHEPIATSVNLYLENKLRASAVSKICKNSLLEDVIHNAKRAAFQDPQNPPLTTAEYLACELEVVLHMPNETMSMRDPSLLQSSLQTRQSP